MNGNIDKIDAAIGHGKTIIDVRDFAGANAGAKIQAIHDSASCTPSGCVIDARGLGATDTITGLNITKPIKVYFGQTTFTVTGSMVFTNVKGPVFEGAGRDITFFSWRGNNSTPMFKLVSVQGANFGGLTLVATTTFPLTAFFTSERGPLGNPTTNSFHDILAQGTNGGVTDGFRWVVGAGGDAGNDTFSFFGVVVANYSNAAWNNAGNTQSQGHVFYNCQAASGSFGKYGYYGVGSFAMYNQQFSLNTVSDVTITNINNGVLISGGLSIGSNRFFTDGATSGEFSVTIQNFNWNNMGLSADGNIAIFGNRGPYLLLGNTFWGNSVAAQFYLSSAAGHQSGTAIGNNITTTLPTPFNNPAGTQWMLFNNTIGLASPTNLPDQLANPLKFTPDNTYDIGASRANRPRDLWVARNSDVAGNFTVHGTCTGCGSGAAWGDAGLSRDAAGVVDVGTGAQGSTAGKLKASAYMSVGTKFTTNAGCGESARANVGGGSAGKITTAGSTSCTTIVTLGDAATAPNGWACSAHDLTTSADYNNPHVSSNTTTATIVTGTIVSGDVIEFSCVGY